MKSVVWTTFLIAVLAMLQAQPADEEFDALFAQAMEALVAQEYDEAIALFGEAIEIRPDEPVCYYNIACAYSLKKDAENALVWFEKSIEMGFDDYDHILKDTDLDYLRDMEEFKNIVEAAFGPKKCPDLTLPDPDGKPVSLSQFLGKVVILDFWASWCPPCRKEIPHFLALHGKYRDQGLVVIGVSDESPSLIKKFAGNHHIDYILLSQPQDVEMSEPFASVQSLPTTFIIDAQGFIVRKYVGYREQDVFEKVVLDLLAKPGEKPMEIEKLIKIAEIPGGYMSQNVDEPGIREMAEKAAALLEKEYPDYRLARVHEAATQVVAGTNYFFILEFSTSDANALWQIIMYHDLSGECEITEKRRVEKLVVPKKEPILGGYLAQDPAEPGIVKIAQKTVEIFQKGHPDYRLLAVREASTQVVAGVNYSLVLEFETSGPNTVWEFIVYEGLDGECEITHQKQRN